MKTKDVLLTLNLNEKELDEVLDKSYEAHKESILSVAENQAIDEIVDEIISEDTVEHYKEAPTKQEFVETLNEMPREDSPIAYQVETKEEIMDNISERVKKRLEEATNKKQPKELKTFEEIDEYLKSMPEKESSAIHWFKQYSENGDGKVFIEPTLLFAYTFQGLQKLEKEKLEEMLKGFKIMYDMALNQGGVALKEKSEDEIVKIMKELVASSLGYDEYILQQHIVALKGLVPGRVAQLCKREDFLRNIPFAPLKKLHEAEKIKFCGKELFEEVWILHLDYTKEKIKSTSEKIKEKDPIIFAKVTSDSDKLIYIADWEDEYCDLTLEKLAELLSKGDDTFKIPKISVTGVCPKRVYQLFSEIVTPKEQKAFIDSKAEREEMLKNTNSANWRSSYNTQKEKERNSSKKGFFQKLFRLK